MMMKIRMLERPYLNISYYLHFVPKPVIKLARETQQKLRGYNLNTPVIMSKKNW